MIAAWHAPRTTTPANAPMKKRGGAELVGLLNDLMALTKTSTLYHEDVYLHYLVGHGRRA